MKNIVRWTIGNVSEEGFECLRRSVSNFLNFYKDQFQYFICYNNIQENKLEWSKKFKINLINQNNFVNSLNINPKDSNPCWKLYPPRINNNVYEIFIDNDIVLHKKINLNEVINKNYFFITQALKRNYGSLDKCIISEFDYNSGFFGVPVGFDFKKEINKIIEKFNINWNLGFGPEGRPGHFEEQGIVSYIINKNKHELINLEKIYISFEDYQLGKYGVHFVGVNTDIKRFWNFYNTKFI